jgi:secondary thiamine-phosphate synthase enzyme
MESKHYFGISKTHGRIEKNMELRIQTSNHSEMIDITHLIQSSIPKDIQDGLCTIYCPHTTAGITINENADPDVRHDLLAKLNELIPWHESFYQHAEGNSAAHLKASLLGFSQTVPIKMGRLELGTWQGIYFCEFDGPRTRKVRLYFQSL